MQSQSYSARLAAILFVLFASVALAAQELKVSPSPNLTQGEEASISYSDPSRAGQTIVVVITSSGINPVQREVQIVLDKNGEGTGSWKVENWRSASFDAPGATTVTRPCLPPGTSLPNWSPTEVVG